MVSKALLVVGGENTHGGARELVPVGNRSLLLRTLDSLQSAGVESVALCLSSGLLDGVRRAVGKGQDWPVELSCIPHEPAAGLAAVLSGAEDFIGGDGFVLHFGDSLSPEPLEPLIAVDDIGRFDSRLLIRDSVNGGSDNVVELLTGNSAPTTRLAGVGVFGPGLVQVARDVQRASRDVELIRAVDRAAELGGRADTRQVEGWWRLGPADDALLEANRFVLDRMPAGGSGKSSPDVVIEGKVWIHETAELDSSVVRGPVLIGPRARIRDAYVGPHTSIGADVVIEGAEIEHSIVLPEARISHIGNRLEASVIGSGARIMRDFRLPKALRVRVGDHAHVSVV